MKMKNEGKQGCLILCGGKSSRMGQDKAKLTYQNRSFLEIICARIKDTGMPCYVSLANYDEQIPAGFIPVYDAVHDENGQTIGPLGGIYTGLKQADKDGLSGLFIVPVDTPLFETEIFELIIKAQEREPDADIFIPVTGDGRIHPVSGFYNVKVTGVMEELIAQHDYRMRSLISHPLLHSAAVVMETAEQERMLRNINSPEDYKALIHTGKQIVLQGERGAGKSTLIQRLAKNLNLTIGGYLTKAVYSEEKRCREIYMFPASSLMADENQDETPLCKGRLCGIAMDGVKETYPDVFDTYGVSLLEEAENVQLIIMDEIGFLENEAYAFQKKVLLALDGKTLMIAAIKTKHKTTPFLEAVRSHENVRLIEIDENNRDTVYEELIRELKEGETG